MDGRDNVEDWFFLENTKRKSANDPESLHSQNETTDPNSKATRKQTKDFIEHELRAMSTLSLYDDSLDKMKTTADADSLSTRSSHVKDELINDLYGLHEKERFLASGENTPTHNSVHSSMRFDDVEMSEDEMEETKTEVDFRVQMSSPETQPGDVTDFPQNPYAAHRTKNDSLFFADGARSVDFVIVWKKLMPHEDDERSDALNQREVDDVSRKESERVERREVFEKNLIDEGLELEHEIVDEEINFVKIHAPLEVLRRYAEILKLRLPMKEIPGLTTVRSQAESFITGTWKYMAKKVLVSEKNFPPISHRFTAIYSRDKEYLFDLHQSSFFNATIRARIVQFILDRQRYRSDNTHDFCFGIDRLLNDETYIAAYPLHDGELTTVGCKRHLLYTKWASLKKCWQYQPLDYIKDYFGVKIGIYFAWLGFYTYMLILASVAGVISFIYSLKWMKNNPISQQICQNNDTIIMCPLCDRLCDYWDLKETCLQAQVTSLFDNPVTVVFAVIMSFWAALFLEHWKRYSAEITHRWDLTGFDVHEEHPRPQYLARLKSIRREKHDYVTNATEPNVPFWRMKLPATVLSVSVVLLLIVVALATVLGVVLYRMSVMASLSLYGKELTTSFAILFTTSTAAMINLVLIVILNFAYEYLAEWLTELELLRTQTEFDDSLTLKIYLLQFVNYYASIFYIAFLKGKFIGTPKNYNRFFDYRQEECGLGGCLMELMIQLAIIMIGKQFMNAILENFWPLLLKYIYSFKLRTGKNRDRSLRGKGKRYITDLKLVEFGSRGLFNEYLEMILQYGFVTIFVAAFPLAPLFALINNICEMRLDAKKFLAYYRRPVFARVKNIGIWYRILDCISKLSVITNGFIIAFTSDFIPRLVYVLYYSPDKSLDGYVEFTLSKFNTSEFKYNTAPVDPAPEYRNVTECRYQDYRYEPSHSTLAYSRTAVFWNVMAARLIFVVLFENAVAVVMILVRWLIPDVSAELRDQIRREAYITNEIIIKQEALRATQAASARPYINSQSAWNRLLANNLSGSQLDLFIHKEDETRKKKRLKRNKTQDFIENEASEHNNNLGEHRKGNEETKV